MFFDDSSNDSCEEDVGGWFEHLDDPRTDDAEVSGVEIIFSKVLFSLDKEDFEPLVVSDAEEPLLNAEEDEECC